MNHPWHHISFGAGLLAASLALCGCANISVNTKAYLGTTTFPPTDPARVQILTAEPNQPHDRLGEVMLSVGGNPSREKVEQRLKRAAAQLGADAVFVQYDTTHVFPVAYANWWGGPYAVYETAYRDIVAVAIKYK